MPREWELAFVLPNLTLPDPRPGVQGDGTDGDWSHGISLGQDCIAIVPRLDPRLVEIANGSPGALKLLSGFRTSGGTPHDPSAIIVRRDAPDSVRTDLGAFVAFRNSVAFSVILPARAAVAAGGNPDVTWSDTFDFHPTVLTDQGRLVTDTDALRAVYADNAAYNATPAPHLAPAGRRLRLDAYLARALGWAWKQRFYRRQRGSPFTTALFRSLEIAATAASAGVKNQGSLSDYGTQIALWVSAIEVLAWPEQRHANLDAVLKVLKRYHWADPALRATSVRRISKKQKGRRRLNPVQYAYVLMYRARNRFLHGEPVSAHTLVPRRLGGTTPVPRLAAVVYRTMLAAYLQGRIASEPLEDVFVRVVYNEALREGLTI